MAKERIGRLFVLPRMIQPIIGSFIEIHVVHTADMGSGGNVVLSTHSKLVSNPFPFLPLSKMFCEIFIMLRYSMAVASGFRRFYLPIFVVFDQCFAQLRCFPQGT